MTTPNVDTCKDCGAPITWATTDRGRPMPINPPSDDGDLYCYDLQTVTTLPGKVAPRIERRVTHDPANIRPGIETKRVTSHFASCPAAAERRKPRS